VYGVERRRVGVVPLGVEGGLLDDGDAIRDDRVAELGVRPPYLLVVGTVLDRRVPRTVLEAFAILRAERPELQLVIAGDNRMRNPGRLGEWTAELGVERNVRVLGWVDDGLLPALYAGAESSLYLSVYEGFGIPPLESLAFATPAVVGPGLALDEIWPEYPYRTASFRVAEVVDIVRRVLDDPTEVGATMTRAQSILETIGWERSSRRLVRELDTAVSS
jgi:alpha-1,3-rhamnosyl/mannosyltransferase